MRHPFFSSRRPVIAGIMAGQTPAELIAEARNAEFEGAQAVAIDLADFKPEFRNTKSFKEVVEAVGLPFMFFFYRQDKWQSSDDGQRQEVLLAAATAGAAMIDVMGDLYDPSPLEITRKPEAVDQQRRLIDRIHAAGAQVVMSSHIQGPRTSEQVVEHLQEFERRGADVVKVVTVVDTQEELAEAIRTTMVLNRTLTKPFIHLCNGSFGRPHRFLSPILGGAIHFAVVRYEPRYQMGQPTIKAMRAVLDNIHWNINDIPAREQA